MNESIHVVGSFILAGILLYGLWQGTRRRRRRTNGNRPARYV